MEAGSIETVFCGNSWCSSDGTDCSSVLLAILNSYSCINHVLVIAVDILLSFICLFALVCSIFSRKINAAYSSRQYLSLQVSSAVFNAGLALVYLGLAVWIILEKLSSDQTVLPLHDWLVTLVQGLTWLLLGLAMSLRTPQVSHIMVKICTILALIFSGLLCASSVLTAIEDQEVSVKSVVDILCLPGAVLLLLCAFKGCAVDNTNNSLYTPLLAEDGNLVVTPFAEAGFCSIMCFWWLNPLMKKGKVKTLEDKDIPQLRQEDRAVTCYLKFIGLMSEWKKKGSSGHLPSVLSAIFHLQRKAIFSSGFFALLKVLSVSTGPLFLNAFIQVAEGNEAFEHEGYVLTAGLFIAKCLESFSERQWYFQVRMIGLQVRSMLSAAIYKKQLRLSNAAKANHSPGEIVNYVTGDAYRIGEFPFWFHQIWSTSIQLCLALAIVYYCVGMATIAALVVILLTVGANTPLGKLQHKYQTKLMISQDKRLKTMTESLTCMKVLKLYAWETHFRNIIGISLNAGNIFTFLATLRLVQEPIRIIPDVASAFIEAKVSLDRIVKFLEAPELEREQIGQKHDQKDITCPIVIKSSDISWNRNSMKPTLRNVNLVIKPGEKLAVCGEVGSGKSTLLAAILGEVPHVNGIVQVNGSVAYVSQTAWIQTGSIKENILFGSVMDPPRYRDVLNRCALVKDLEALPFGDLTEIGERGINLSGGQKQRVQLARALYQDADIYLLDDPFSAVDAHTATSLFNEYVMGALSGKTVLLVTHQVDFLPTFDSILLMSEGAILQAGRYNQLLASSQEFQDLVNAHNETTSSERPDEYSSKQHKTPKQEIHNIYNEAQQIAPQGEQLIKLEEREKGDTGLKPYRQYLSQSKGYWYFSLATLAHLLFIVSQLIQNYWLAANVRNSSVSELVLVAVYTIIGCGLGLFLFLRSTWIVILSYQSAEAIFSTLLGSLFKAPMSFYDATPLGRILSRVSSDMNIVDTELAFKFTFAVGAALNAYSMFLIMGILAWPIFILIIPTILLTIYLQKYYSASANELMRITGTTKSSVASQLSETIAGAMTIRAFGEEDRFFSTNLDLIDKNASPFFHSFSANEWLIQRLEILCAIVLSATALSITLLNLGASESGLIGMALSYGLSLNIFLSFAVQNQCMLSNMIISVERLEQYMHIPSEAPEVIESHRPPSSWPAFGKVEICNLKVRYRPDAPLVLHGISCTFEGGWKIGIVGRTGSGKTTLIGALFRLVEPTEGKIIIDDIDVSTIGLHDLRSRLGIIPQDPTLFAGSVRYNLDPLSEHSDREIWEVLDKCQLREAVQEKEGLNAYVVQDGSNWSMGQRQLFCLGRALLKRSRILVLDEATASIDNATDSILQKTIRTEFKDSTVITVAHRIPTVIDCNMVLGMKDGEVVEFDEPLKLMNREEGSLFGKLVKEYWSRTANVSMPSEDWVAHRIPAVMDCNMVLATKDGLQHASKNMMGGSFETVLCGDSWCSSSNCSSILLAIVDSYSCINHLLVISVDILLSLICLFALVYPIFSRKNNAASSFQPFLSLLVSSAVFNAGLALVYLGLGIWTVLNKLSSDQTVLPLHEWLILLLQGFTWLLLGLAMSFRSPRVSYVMVKLCTILALFFAGFLCASSVLTAIEDKEVSVKSVLDILCLPGSILLLFCAFKGYAIGGSGNNNDALYAPLLAEDTNSVSQVDSGANVTPFAKAGFCSRMSFWWLNPLMKKGNKKTLEDTDIPHLRQEDQAKTCYFKFMELISERKQKGSSDSPSVLSAIFHMHRKTIISSGIFAFVKVVLLSTGPLFLNAFIQVAEGNEAFAYEGYALTAGLFIAKCFESFAERQWFFQVRMIGLQVRSMLSAAIYQKQLGLSNVAKATHSPGEIVNYVTGDAYRIGESLYWFHQTWSTVLQLCLALAIVYYCVGMATFAALVVVVFTVFANTPLGKVQHKYQTKLMVTQDKRLKTMTEALTSMKVLKLYAWETHFRNVIDGLRSDEVVWITALLKQKGYNIILFWASPIIVAAVTFWTCYFLGISLNASNVFTFLATLRLVQEPIRTLPDVATALIEAKVSLDRIVKFLESPQLQREHIRPKCDHEDITHSILIRSTDISWNSNSLNPTIRNIDMLMKPGEKLAICGEVGSGKSTLLAAILGEVPHVNGIVQVNGSIAYVSQSAWIQTGSIQENILFGSAMDPPKYRDVLNRCSLVKDLEALPFGDLTEIGERGVNLSGGQKQRIQLARALYQDADIYLLDDPFSAVDAHTATSLFNEYVMGALSGKTVLLVTHQVDFLPTFDSILLMSNGAILQAGTYDQLLASSREFQDLVNAHKETAGSDRPDKYTSKQHKTSKEEIRSLHTEEKQIASQGEQLIKQEEREKGGTGFKPYLQYLNQSRGYWYFSLATLSHIIFIVGQLLQSYWLAANVRNSSVSELVLVEVYTIIGCSLGIFLFLRSHWVVILGFKASKAIFSTLLGSLFRAPMSFYDSTPLGRILSRVSSDMNIVDTEVAFKLTFAVGAALNAYSMFLIMSILAWPILILIIPMICLTLYLQKYYITTATELMRITGTTKSSVASQLSESIAGAMTIRAFREEDRFFSKNLDLIDRNANPFFHSFSANEWLIQRLEILSAIVLSATALAITLLDLGASESGLIGMTLSYGLSLNVFLASSVQVQCQLANMIISVERLEQYMHIPSEAPEVIEGHRPPPSWPATGKVEICNLKVRYREDAPLVLRGISCIFEGGQKIGIVGRTGSGKTTLISALFRLVEPTEGKIIIDDIDVSTIGLHDLRSNLGIIPQDPTLFAGSVRYNLDPLSEHSDRELWEVLDKCQLQEAVQEKEQGLDSYVVQDGTNWSMGQRQLFCLGRALLKRSRILVLDEATASIDNATDSIIQRTIRTEFKFCTVITVAHRIPTVMDSDMVLGMKDGEIVEFDQPLRLMNTEGSLFEQLVREYWSRTADRSSHTED
ncbi:ABC transporter-like, ATP-binding domain [Dillenia turbinata]|uniref:ABC-type xenobiotic transporter n=1 Tax=Dillenia turbinata TaxID=194707 RepID=A0AAN8WKK1_9MAGN